jgi:hypothetical protein
MKAIKLFLAFLLITISSCGTMISINADYDSTIDFSKYKSYAYYKPGIDKAEISDLDKRRILKAIDEKMVEKGFIKSETPDLLISIFTKSRDQVNVNQFNTGWGWGLGWGWGWGWGWNPFMMGGQQTSVSTSTEGTLYIDFIDATKKELIWQGEGSGFLTKNTAKKDERIKEFVTTILAQYPPTMNK